MFVLVRLMSVTGRVPVQGETRAWPTLYSVGIKEAVSANSCARWRRFLRMADLALPVRQGPRRRHRGQPLAPQHRQRARGGLADADLPDERPAAGVEGGQRQGTRLAPLRRSRQLRPVALADPGVPAGCAGALRRAAGRALLDEELVAQALHGQQQHQRDQQRARRGRRVGPRHPRRPPRHDGRVRLRHGRHAYPGGIPEGRGGRPTMAGGSSRRSSTRPTRAASTT